MSEPNGNGNGTAMPILIPQPNGRGALLSGGMPGNAGGSGPAPSELRARLRGSFAQRMHVLEQFADGVVTITEQCPACGYQAEPTTEALSLTPADRTRAMALLAKYGLGLEKTIRLEGFTDVQRAFDIIKQCQRKRLGAELAEALEAEIVEALSEAIRT